MHKYFSELWDRIYNPRSACPDIEIDSVLYLMVEILVKHDESDSPLEKKWVLALIKICPRKLNAIKFNWTDWYINIYDYNDFDRYDQDVLNENKKIFKVIKELEKDGLIYLKDDKYYFNELKHI